MMKKIFSARAKRRPLRWMRRWKRRRQPAYRIVLVSALQGALLAGTRQSLAGVGMRCIATFAAKGALVGAAAAAVPLVLTWSSLGVELGYLVKVLGESRLLRGKC